MINIKQFERPFQDEFQLECHARNVNQEQTHASTAFNVNDVANWLMRSLMIEKFRNFREKRFALNPHICLKKKKERKKFVLSSNKKLSGRHFFFHFLFFFQFSFLFFFFKQTNTAKSCRKERKREKEKSLFHELNKFRNLTNRVFFTLFSLSRLIKYHYMENEIIGFIYIYSFDLLWLVLETDRNCKIN